MKKTNFIKLITALVCTLCILIGNFQVAFASPTVIDTPATVTIYADPTNTDGNGTGTHAFLSIHNNLTTTLTVGYYRLAPNQEITLGTWGNKSEHKGIWYNLENYFIVTRGYYNNRTSLTIDISNSQLTNLNNYISNHDTWSFTYNCSSFAAGAWNSLRDVQVSAGTVNTPANLANSINSKTGHQYNRSLPGCTSSQVYYTNGTGKTQVSSSSSSLSGSSSSS